MSDDQPTTLRSWSEEAVVHVRLNRPEVRNAFNGEVVRELREVFAAIDRDDDARVVVLSGEGKSFSAGADLAWMKEQAELSKDRNVESAAEMAGMFLAIARCNKPVVARVHGHALGGGCGLTAAADIAIAADDTVFGLTEVKLGIVPAVISPFVLQKIGAGRARRLFLTGERFAGRAAERIGLVHAAVPAERLDAEVARLVGELSTSGPRAVSSAKQLIAAIDGRSLEEAIPITSRWIADLRATEEAAEGMRAFLEKRKPSWS